MSYHPLSTSPRTWPVWKLPRRAVHLIISVEIGAALSIPLWANWGYRELLTLLAIAAAGMVSSVISRSSIWLRRRTDKGVLLNTTGTWMFAAVVATGRGWPAVLAITLYLFEWLLLKRRTPFHQVALNASVIVLSCVAASVTNDLAVAGLLYMVVNISLTTAVVRLAKGREYVRRMGSLSMQAIDVAILALGGVIGEMVLRGHLWSVLLAVPVLAGLQHAILRLQLLSPDIDRATRATVQAAWTVDAERQTQSRTAATVVLIDCEPTRANHDLIRSTIRPHDTIGRIGHGFATFHPNVGNLTRGADTIADELRAALGEQYAAVGYATKPDMGANFDALWVSAMADLMLDRALQAA